MNSDPKKTVRGFTLLELMIVMVIFSGIMFGALQLIDPVRELFLRTNNYESTATAVDNMRVYLEGNVGPVEFIHVYNGALYGNESGGPQGITEAQAVEKFIDHYHLNRVVHDGSSNTAPQSCNYALVDVHVIKIDNTTAGEGKISKKVYTVNCETLENSDVLKHSPTVENIEYAVNQTYFDNYTYTIELGSNGLPATYDNFSLTITAYPRLVTQHGMQMSESASTIASIGMSNVVSTYGRKDASSTIRLDTNGDIMYEADGVTPQMRSNVLAVGWYTARRVDASNNVIVEKAELKEPPYILYDAVSVPETASAADGNSDGIADEIYMIFSYPII